MDELPFIETGTIDVGGGEITESDRTTAALNAVFFCCVAQLL